MPQVRIKAETVIQTHLHFAAYLLLGPFSWVPAAQRDAPTATTQFSTTTWPLAFVRKPWRDPDCQSLPISTLEDKAWATEMRRNKGEQKVEKESGPHVQRWPSHRGQEFTSYLREKVTGDTEELCLATRQRHTGCEHHMWHIELLQSRTGTLEM